MTEQEIKRRAFLLSCIEQGVKLDGEQQAELDLLNEAYAIDEAKTNAVVVAPALQGMSNERQSMIRNMTNEQGILEPASLDKSDKTAFPKRVKGVTATEEQKNASQAPTEYLRAIAANEELNGTEEQTHARFNSLGDDLKSKGVFKTHGVTLVVKRGRQLHLVMMEKKLAKMDKGNQRNYLLGVKDTDGKLQQAEAISELVERGMELKEAQEVALLYAGRLGIG